MRKNLSLLFVFLLVIALVVGLTACGGGGADKGSGEKAAEKQSSDKPADSKPSVKPQTITLTTGNQASAIYMLGGALATQLEKNIPGLRVAVETSQGYQENAMLVATNMAQIGTTSPMSATAVFEKQGKPELMDNLRILATAHRNQVHFVVLADSDIKSVEDFKGRNVSVGPAGSGTLLRTTEVLNAYGIDVKKDINPKYLSFSESVDALKDGVVEVISLVTMMPNPGVMSLAAEKKIRLIPLNKDLMEKTIEERSNDVKWQDIVIDTIPAGLYEGVDVDTITVASMTCYVVNKDLPEDLVYQITKTFIEKAPEVAKVHPAAKQWTLEGAVKGRGIPYHPGAIKYYREKGVWKK